MLRHIPAIKAPIKIMHPANVTVFKNILTPNTPQQAMVNFPPQCFNIIAERRARTPLSAKETAITSAEIAKKIVVCDHGDSTTAEGAMPSKIYNVGIAIDGTNLFMVSSATASTPQTVITKNIFMVLSKGKRKKIHGKTKLSINLICFPEKDVVITFPPIIYILSNSINTTMVCRDIYHVFILTLFVFSIYNLFFVE